MHRIEALLARDMMLTIGRVQGMVAINVQSYNPSIPTPPGGVGFAGDDLEACFEGLTAYVEQRLRELAAAQEAERLRAQKRAAQAEKLRKRKRVARRDR